MTGVLVPLALGGIGVYLLVWAVRAGRSLLTTPPPPGPAQAAAGEKVLVTGQVLAPPTPLTSPLQGVACAYWHVRAVRIRERNASARAAAVQVQVDIEASSPQALTVRTDLGDVTVQAAASRMASGLTVIHRDQASVPRSLVLAGQSHQLPAVAHGTRQVKEGALRPGDAVWIEGRLATGPSGPVVTGQAEDPVVINTTPLASRRRTALTVVVLCTVVGVILIGAALVALVG